jgi:two-component system OmpR family response regulator
VGKLIIVIAPDEIYWDGLRRLLAVSDVELSVHSNLRDFTKSGFDPQGTIVLIDADQTGDKRLSLISSLIASHYVGVITVSSEMSQPERVALMCSGVDHCLLRPVDGQELSAIVNNMFRHSGGGLDLSADPETPGSWMLDLNKWKLKTPTGHDICLSSSERNLLAILLREPGMPKLRRDIRSHLTDSPRGCDGRSLDVLISRLRRKVEDASAMKLPLRSARGAGYVFTSSATIV